MRERLERALTVLSPDDLRPHPEEGASSAFTRVFDALLAPVSKDGGGPKLRDGGFRRLSMRPNIARAREDRPNTTPAPRYRETGADFKHAIREGDDAQLMLSVAVEARRTLIGRTTTLAPTWTRL
jgi:hypothetical protein